MKRLASIVMAVMMVACVSTPLYAFSAGREGRRSSHVGNNYHRVYEPGRYSHQRIQKPVRHAYRQPSNHYMPAPRSGAVVSLPLVPLPGVSHWFPSINIRIR